MGRTAIDGKRSHGHSAAGILAPGAEICRPMVYLMEKQTGGRGRRPEKVKTDGWNRGNVYGVCPRRV